MGQGTMKLESGLELLSGVEVFVNASGNRESLGVTDEKGELTTTTDLPNGVMYDTDVRVCDGELVSVELVFEGQRHVHEAPTLGNRKPPNSTGASRCFKWVRSGRPPAPVRRFRASPGRAPYGAGLCAG
jgi:hypothetical protein